MMVCVNKNNIRTMYWNVGNLSRKETQINEDRAKLLVGVV